MNTTSIAGYTLWARSIRTASVIEAVSARWGAKLSTAHWMILVAGSRSNSMLSSASSASAKSSGVFGCPEVRGAASGVALVRVVVLMNELRVRQGAEAVLGGSREGVVSGVRGREEEERSGRALPFADLGHVGPGLAVVDVVVGRFFGEGEVVELLELGA